MIQLTFPDGAVRDYPDGTTGRAVAESVSRSLGRDAVIVRLDGRLYDL